MTKVVRVDGQRPDVATLAEAADCLRSGGLVGFPTETVYGLGANALDEKAVRRIFEAKARPTSDPLIVHVPTDADARALTSAWPPAAEHLTRRFWPGPLTIVLPKASAVPDVVTAGLPSVALRCPAHPVALALIRAAGVPIAAPSANLFSRPSPTTAEHVIADLEGRIDYVVDGGPTSVGVESTVVDLTHPDRPRVLRPGGVPIEDVAAVLGQTPLVEDVLAVGDQPLPSPGLLERHYSPRTRMVTFEGTLDAVAARLTSQARREVAAGRRVGLLVVDELGPAATGLGLVRHVGPSTSPDAMAARLYAALRDLDESDVDLILASSVADGKGLGAAIRDRLRRAAAGHVIRC